MSVHDIGVDMAAVTVHNLRPDTTYRFRVMWRTQHDQKAHFTDVVLARTTGTVYSLSQKNPPEVFWHFPPHCWEFLVQISRAYYTFLSTLDYTFLFNYLQL